MAVRMHYKYFIFKKCAIMLYCLSFCILISTNQTLLFAQKMNTQVQPFFA